MWVINHIFIIMITYLLFKEYQSTQFRILLKQIKQPKFVLRSLQFHCKLRYTYIIYWNNIIISFNCKHFYSYRCNARRPNQKQMQSLHSPSVLVAIYRQRQNSGNQILQSPDQNSMPYTSNATNKFSLV